MAAKVDPRKLMAMGLLLGAGTMFAFSHLNLDAGYWDIFWPQVLQGVALALLFIPLMALSMSGIPKEKMGNATSIFNLMRNIGGSFGIAIMTTFLSRRSQYHQARLVENVTSGNLMLRNMLGGMKTWFLAHGVDAYDAQRKAFAAVYGMVQQHAMMLAFVEAFFVMSIMFLTMMPMLLLLRYSKPKTEVEELQSAGTQPSETRSHVPPEQVAEPEPELVAH